MKKKLVKVANKEEELDKLWMNINEHELTVMDSVNTSFMVQPIKGDAAIFKRMATNESVENLGLDR